MSTLERAGAKGANVASGIDNHYEVSARVTNALGNSIRNCIKTRIRHKAMKRK